MQRSRWKGACWEKRAAGRDCLLWLCLKGGGEAKPLPCKGSVLLQDICQAYGDSWLAGKASWNAGISAEIQFRWMGMVYPCSSLQQCGSLGKEP